MTLKLINNLTKKEYELTNLADLNMSRLFYTFDITFPANMDDGEYSYTLYDGDVVKATGLLQVGDYTPEKTTYENNEIKEQNGYVQYRG